MSLQNNNNNDHTGSKSPNNLKVAIVHDWLVGGGAEKVIQQLHQLYPDAPIYTSYCTPEWRQKLNNKVVTGYLQYWPFSKLRRLAVIMSWPRIWWFRSIDFTKFDLVISSTGNGEANNIKVPKTTKHISYIHAPTHYYWRSYQKYLKNPGYGPLNFFARIGLKFFVGPLRKQDYLAAQRPYKLIANSNFIANEIKKYYDRDSIVIYPPVNIDRFIKSQNTNRSGFITVGRQVLYKHTEIIIEACNQLQLPLKVIGQGPEHIRLKKIAGPTVEILDNVSDEQVVKLLNSSKAFIFAAEEDFGIAPVEALASGTPVIAYKAGGALDYVVPNKTGLLFDRQTTGSLIDTLKKFEETKFSHKEISKFSEKFSEEKFRANLTKALK